MQALLVLSIFALLMISLSLSVEYMGIIWIVIIVIATIGVIVLLIRNRRRKSVDDET